MSAPEPPDGEPIYVEQPYPGPPPNPYAVAPPFPGNGYSYGYAWPPAAVRPAVSEPVVGWLLVVLGALISIAALLPWASAVGVTISGTNGDGKITLVCGLVVAVLGVIIGLGHGVLWTSITALTFSVIAGLIGLVDVVHGVHVVGEFDGLVVIEDGLWITLVAGLLSVGMSIVALVRRGAAPGR